MLEEERLEQERLTWGFLERERLEREKIAREHFAQLLEEETDRREEAFNKQRAEQEARNKQMTEYEALRKKKAEQEAARGNRAGKGCSIIERTPRDTACPRDRGEKCEGSKRTSTPGSEVGKGSTFETGTSAKRASFEARARSACADPARSRKGTLSPCKLRLEANSHLESLWIARPLVLRERAPKAPHGCFVKNQQRQPRHIRKQVTKEIETISLPICIYRFGSLQ